ncbi:LysR family transcriptional regulator [Rhizobium sp. G187]|uniref:LysR family transcriptional regulator n=1 Tax=Rhizobium sp. G187 TaxID=3451352 RepID=UPI003EE6C278
MSDAPVDLGWMRLLVEVDRRGSLSAAAEAMGLSQPAVSYQIRTLEQRFGCALLLRLHRGVRFTEDGRRLLAVAIRTVEEVDGLERAIKAARRRPAVRLTTDYAFSGLWLIPRMQAFRAQNPDVDLQIVASQRLGSHWRDTADVAVAFGHRSTFEEGAKLLMPEKVVPVCAPSIRARLQLGVSDDLDMVPRIHLDADPSSPWLDWPAYVAESGIGGNLGHAAGDLRFNTYSMVIQAALGGQGVALGWLGVVDQLLEAGLLVVAGAEVEVPDRGYWLIAANESSPTAQLARWLEAESGVGWRRDERSETAVR